ncbi:MAK10-like protein [Tanacetum coccineum]
MHTVRGDGVTGIKRRRHDLSGDGVMNLATASGRGRLKEDLKSSTWRRRQDFKATPSQEQCGTSLIRHHSVGAKRMLIPRTSVRGSKPTCQGFLKTSSNWLERLPAGSITTWEDLTTHFLAQCEIDRTADSKLRDKNTDESWEIIENLALYDHEGWNDSKEFVKPVKAISTPQSTSKTPDRRLLELEDQINFLLKGSQLTPRPSQTHTPQAYAEAVLGTTFEARVRDYMTAHTERMERFENVIFKQREEINNRMAEMFGLLKELTTSRAPEKVLIGEEAKSPVTKNVNSISLAKGEKERNDNDDMAADGGINRTHTEMLLKEAEKEAEAENGTKNKPIKRTEREKHRRHPALSPGPVYEAILRKKITRKEDIGGNFELHCNIGGLKRMNALVDQGFDVNVRPLSTDVKLTNESPAETDNRLSLASHSYIYPLGIAEDVLVDVVGYVYPVDFVILDIKEYEKRPFIIGTPFLITAKAVIKFDKGTITLRSRKTGFEDPHYLRAMLGSIDFDCLYLVNEFIIPRFILEYFSQVQLSYNENGEMSIIFIIQEKFISYTLFEFGQILCIPSEGQCSCTDEWSLDALLREHCLSGPYHTELPTPEDIRLFIQNERSEHTRLIKGMVTHLDENKIHTKEIQPNMKT